MVKTSCELFGVGPVLPVRGVRATVDFYCEKLGFTRDGLWGDPPTHGSVTRGRAGIQFTQAPAGYETRSYPGWTYIFVTEVDNLWEEYRVKGLTILKAPQDHAHGMREFEVEDGEGYRLRFGQYRES